jgi:hypothetical protein
VVGFAVPDDLWMAVVGDENTCWCPACFDEEAQKKKVSYFFETEKLFPVSWSDWEKEETAWRIGTTNRFVEWLETLLGTHVFGPKYDRKTNLLEFGVATKLMEGGERWFIKIPLTAIQQLSNRLGTTDIDIEVYEGSGNTDIVVTCRGLTNLEGVIAP